MNAAMPDLKVLLDREGVSAEMQEKFYEAGTLNMRKFATFAAAAMSFGSPWTRTLSLLCLKAACLSVSSQMSVLKTDLGVLEAVQQDGFALHFAATKLQSDHDVLEARKLDVFALHFAAARIQSDHDVLVA